MRFSQAHFVLYVSVTCNVAAALECSWFAVGRTRSERQVGDLERRFDAAAELPIFLLVSGVEAGLLARRIPPRLDAEIVDQHEIARRQSHISNGGALHDVLGPAVVEGSGVGALGQRP